MADGPLEQMLRVYFDSCASTLPEHPDLEDLCRASSKEARLWARPEVYEDLMESVREQLELEPSHRLLEVGCAAGFLAIGLAKRCAGYVGVDLSAVAIEKARTLPLPNARFEAADGARLPFEDGAFDRVISYDVFTNFPGMEVAGRVAAEMLRVTAAGGKTMIGAVPDAARRDEYFAWAQEVGRDLDARYGAGRAAAPERPPWRIRARRWYLRRVRRVDLSVVNHLFQKEDFLAFAERQGVRATIHPGHDLSPYRDFRFNALLHKDG